ncbi:nitroreductase [Roseibium porphyridii]|uniref:Putative NAD(P)H nitroreductase n=1 Tax=Roseibium porphyridii TaxID=2866279 RepID=A0ABY8F9V7_9HYPH|nr:nitroreductase [Roseibium sp. KMA01]WFE92242.1 nitroreductase [Roseibium sp. KMA01]
MPNQDTMSPETLSFLRQRRSHPSVTMSSPGPDDDQIRDILTIAARVPDHGKLSPWRFVLYPSEQSETIGAWLAARCESLNGPLDYEQRQKELTRFQRAPRVIGVVSTAAEHPKIPIWEQQLSAGAVCMNLVTAAAASGYVSQWLTEWFAFDEEASRYLGAGENERFAGFVHIGTATQPPVERQRPDLAQLISNWTQAD